VEAEQADEVFSEYIMCGRGAWGELSSVVTEQACSIRWWIFCLDCSSGFNELGACSAASNQIQMSLKATFSTSKLFWILL